MPKELSQRTLATLRTVTRIRGMHPLSSKPGWVTALIRKSSVVSTKPSMTFDGLKKVLVPVHLRTPAVRRELVVEVTEPSAPAV